GLFPKSAIPFDQVEFFEQSLSRLIETIERIDPVLRLIAWVRKWWAQALVAALACLGLVLGARGCAPVPPPPRGLRIELEEPIRWSRPGTTRLTGRVFIEGGDEAPSSTVVTIGADPSP